MTTYYVSTTGSDQADGSASSPWRTINFAMNRSFQPNDGVIVKSGLYTERVWIGNGGTAAGNVVLRSEVPGGAKIKAPAGEYSAVVVRDDYVTVKGFDIQGGSGHGIDGERVHHTLVTGNTVHDSGGSGISFYLSEFMTIENNHVYGNASSNGYHTSGISVASNINVSGDTTTTGFRTIIRNNVSHHNVEITSPGEHTDGNGIIIDWFRNIGTGNPAYNYATLVENNVVYNNGGKGVQVFLSDNVTVRNNTSWHNNADLRNPGTARMEISNQDGANNTFYNNIAVTDPSINPNNTAIGDHGTYNSNTTWTNNLTFNGTPGQGSAIAYNGNEPITAADGNLLGVDPRFVDPANGNFNLLPDSPAINSGTSKGGLGNFDVDGDARVVGVVDIGAQEYGPTVTPPAPINAAPTFTSPTSFTINENGTSVGTLAATDSDGDTLTYAISGGADAASFQVDSSTGQLSFRAAPDFEAPKDSDRNNVYGVQVSVNDGKSAAIPSSLAVTVRDVSDTTPTPNPPPSTGSSLFGSGSAPKAVETNDREGYELGVKFQPVVDGQITALRYWRGDADSWDTDTRTLNLWNANGVKLASAEVTSTRGQVGWQTVTLSNAVDVKAGSTYVSSYGTNDNYANTTYYFGSSTTSNGDETLKLPGDNIGVFNSNLGAFPTQSWHSSNYWADVVFKGSATGSATTAPAPGLVLTGTSSADYLVGGEGADTISGDRGSDVLIGRGGNDSIWGGSGSDVINGGVGADALRGNSGRDVFKYADAADSTPGSRDVISDFTANYDKIEFGDIDAIVGGQDDDFTWISSQDFHGRAGELRAQATSEGMLLEADVDGDGAADIAVLLANLTGLSSSDIEL